MDFEEVAKQIDSMRAEMTKQVADFADRLTAGWPAQKAAIAKPLEQSDAYVAAMAKQIEAVVEQYRESAEKLAADGAALVAQLKETAGLSTRGRPRP